MYEKSSEIRQFRVLEYREEPEMAPSRSAEVARDERDMEKAAPMEAVGSIIDSGQEAKTEILYYFREGCCSQYRYSGKSRKWR